MLLRQLEYLSALARERHFGRAAAACHVSQPALSEAIRRLEAELGVQVVRRGRSFEGFTLEGERAVAWAQRIVADSAALRGDVSSLRAGLTGTLRIGAITTALAVTTLLTGPFCERHPQVRISVESVSSREIVHRLAEFDLDVGLTYLDGEPLGPVRGSTLYRERYLLLTPAGGRFADRGDVGWAELPDTELCLLAPSMQQRRIIDRYCAEAGVTLVPSMQADTIPVLFGHVAARRCSTVIAHAWLPMFGVPDGMRIVPMRRPPRSYQIGLVLTERQPESMLGRAMVDIAAELDVRQLLDRMVSDRLPS
jgi:DNA-binding transcriptional LysR family regulator